MREAVQPNISSIWGTSEDMSVGFTAAALVHGLPAWMRDGYSISAAGSTPYDP